jgi:hypothetical protein
LRGSNTSMPGPSNRSRTSLAAASFDVLVCPPGASFSPLIAQRSPSLCPVTAMKGNSDTRSPTAMRSVSSGGA